MALAGKIMSLIEFEFNLERQASEYCVVDEERLLDYNDAPRMVLTRGHSEPKFTPSKAYKIGVPLHQLQLHGFKECTTRMLQLYWICLK